MASRKSSSSKLDALLLSVAVTGAILTFPTLNCMLPAGSIQFRVGKVKIAPVTATESSNASNLELDDFLDAIKTLTNNIIAKRRKRNKK